MGTVYMYNREILLRAPEPEDVELMYDIENQSELWGISNTTVPYSRFLLKRYIETACGDVYADKQMRLIIEHREDNCPVGVIDLTDFNPLHNRAEVGIVIKKRYRKHGWARQALSLLTEYSFCYLHIHQLYAFIAFDNADSRKLFAACGFTEIAVLPHWVRVEDEYQDAVLVQRLTE